MSLPIPVQAAKLPAGYEAAKSAISKCYEIDECKDWANKAEALASYARQSKDETLLKTAMRIQGRAVRRVGELLREIEAKHGGDRKSKGRQSPLDRTSAAREAGLSRDQKRTALRVANVPEDQFEKEVESDQPPTVTKLADMGTAKQKAVFDHIAKESSRPGFKEATYAVGAIEDFVKENCSKAPAFIAGGTSKFQHAKIKRITQQVIRWLTEFESLLEG